MLPIADWPPPRPLFRISPHFTWFLQQVWATPET